MLQCPSASGNSGYKLTAQPSLVSNLRIFVLDQMLLRSSVIVLQANQGLWFLLTGDRRLLILLMAYPTPFCMPHGSAWRPSLSWHSLHKKVSIWASLYPMQNFWVSTSGLHSWHSRLLFAISTTSMKICWRPSHLLVDISISWPWWTVLPDSQKQFPSHIGPHPNMPERWSYIGFPILVFLWNVVWQWVAVHIKDLASI